MDPVVGLMPHSHGGATFDFWGLAGHKSLQHDGARLLLTSKLLHERIRVHLCDGLYDWMPYGYVIGAGTSSDALRHSLDAAVAFMSQLEPAPSGHAHSRPSHSAVVHMRALQAYDGVCAGASHRQIASALFGEDLVSAKWQPDSELRAHVRYLIRRARFLVNLGYMTLLPSRSSRDGDAAPFVNAP